MDKKEKLKTLIYGISIGIFFLIAIFLWFLVQYDFAGATFYMFGVKGSYLAFGHIEGYQGFFIFVLPPVLAVGGMLCCAIALVKQAAKIKAYLYMVCAVIALLCVIVYINAYFNITLRFGNVLWTASFWVAFALYFIALVISAYAAFEFFAKKSNPDKAASA